MMGELTFQCWVWYFEKKYEDEMKQLERSKKKGGGETLTSSIQDIDNIKDVRELFKKGDEFSWNTYVLLRDIEPVLTKLVLERLNLKENDIKQGTNGANKLMDDDILKLFDVILNEGIEFDHLFNF